MSAFNELVITSDTETFSIQFKHGLNWQQRYIIGDKIDWGQINRPPSADGIVIVPGISAPRSGNDVRFFSIKFENDVITDLQEISEEDYDKLLKHKEVTI